MHSVDFQSAVSCKSPLRGRFYEAFIALYSLVQVKDCSGNQKGSATAPFCSLCSPPADKIDCKIALLSVMMSRRLGDRVVQPKASMLL